MSKKTTVKPLDNDATLTTIKLSSISYELLEHIADKFQQRKTKGSYWSSGNEELDNLLGGLRHGDLIVFTGFLGQLKSSLTIQLLNHILIKENKNILMLSSSLSEQQIGHSMLCTAAKLPTRILKGKIKDDEWPQITRTLSLYEDKPFYVHTAADTYPELFSSQLRDFIQTKQIDMLVIDPLHISHIDPHHVMKNLKILAEAYDIAVLAVIDLYRTDIKIHQPGISDLPSATIKDNADVYFINRSPGNEDSIIIRSRGKESHLTFDNNSQNFEGFYQSAIN